MKKTVSILLAIIVVLLALNLFGGYFSFLTAQQNSPFQKEGGQIGRYQIISAGAAMDRFDRLNVAYIIIDTGTGKIVEKDRYRFPHF